MKLSVVILPTDRWRSAQRTWRLAEEWGLHAAYTYDHLSWRSFREKSWFAMIPTLTAAAAITETIRLGPLVTTPNFRHPVVIAKDLLALDDISNGRLTIGVGAGGHGFDASALGTPPLRPAQQHDRFVEFVTTLDHLLANDNGNFEGAWYQARDTRQLPGPVQTPRPPLIISALGPRALTFAARNGDGWISIGEPSSGTRSTWEAIRDQSSVISQVRDSVDGKKNFERLLLDMQTDEHPLASLDAFYDWAARYHALGITELVVHWPVADSPFENDFSTFEEIVTIGRATIAEWT